MKRDWSAERIRHGTGIPPVPGAAARLWLGLAAAAISACRNNPSATARPPRSVMSTPLKSRLVKPQQLLPLFDSSRPVLKSASSVKRLSDRSSEVKALLLWQLGQLVVVARQFVHKGVHVIVQQTAPFQIKGLQGVVAEQDGERLGRHEAFLLLLAAANHIHDRRAGCESAGPAGGAFEPVPKRPRRGRRTAAALLL